MSVAEMFLFGLDTEFSPPGGPTGEGVTDALERIVDELHVLADIDTARTTIDGPMVRLTLEVVVDAADDFDAVMKGAALLRDALSRSGFDADELFGPRVEIATHVRPLALAG